MAYAEKVFKTAKGKKLKTFTWRSRYKEPDGTWGSEPGFPTKTTAVAWGNDQEARSEAGRWIAPKKQDTTFGAFAQQFMASNSKRGQTVSTRRRYLDTYLLPKWQHTSIRDFNWFEVDGWQQGLPCDDVTRGHVVSLLSTILTAAMDAGLRDVNPIYGRRRTKPTGKDAVKDKPKKVVGNDGVVPPERAILLAQRLGPVNGLLVLTTAFVGPRYGEAIGLHRDNVLRTREQLWEAGTFTCPVLRIVEEVAEYDVFDKETGKKTGTFHGIEETKNDGSARDVDVPPFLALLLRYHLADFSGDRIFSTPNGKLWRRGNWGKVLRPAADGRKERKKRQGVSPRDAWEPIMPGLDMRALRHTADSYQSQIGVKEPLAYEAMGHKREGIKAVYQHPTVEMRIARLEGLEEIFQRAMRNLGLRTLWNRVDLQKIPQTITAQDRQVA
jgi:integrase